MQERASRNVVAKTIFAALAVALAVGLHVGLQATMTGAHASPQVAAPSSPAATSPRTLPPDSPEFDQGQPQPDIDEVEDTVLAEAMVRFIVGFYLTGEDLTAAEIAELYAPTVAYNGEAAKSREDVARDKLAYVKRWPKRRFDVVPDTIEVVRDSIGPKFVDVVFEYTFEVRSGKRVSRGRGSASLTLDFTSPRAQIVREDSKIISRH